MCERGVWPGVSADGDHPEAGGEAQDNSTDGRKDLEKTVVNRAQCEDHVTPKKGKPTWRFTNRGQRVFSRGLGRGKEAEGPVLTALLSSFSVQAGL